MFTKLSDIDRRFRTMDLFRNKIDRLLSDYDRSYLYNPASTLRSNSLKTNLLESGDRFEVQVEVPGISKDDLNIKIQGNYLEISGKRSVETPEGYKKHRNERGSSTFSRSFTLPNDIDAEKVEAALKDGILYLTLPKLETAKPKQITIS
ncbi:Hsp20/alpha crystallin family protein [Desulfobacter hydrogenophilus]|uniref:Hsp20/alpha crystallin family protein n=1 Tax=Desulfobacter hydrogenophilus TaxID=2291 RepID=A0A328FH94_9BACT|nr:Hsp20/alpha crystallin family protein [Desulfobacter hydrogenophilus]NDY70874.1 Hsp20/alpha crystallin family protein [Desulfobacter hydrogenophilus]QBH11644.1 Hsp20/alpha crystallin family protein [Desulfobacter hydrogenophilus]RAM03190.1 Hsp20/alpha crystallin family protein [Desulfobacter hydrogenophilus]